MKVDAHRNIQPGTVYKGLQPVPADVVQSTYNGLYIPAPLLRGSVDTKVSHSFWRFPVLSGRDIIPLRLLILQVEQIRNKFS